MDEEAQLKAQIRAVVEAREQLVAVQIWHRYRALVELHGEPPFHTQFDEWLEQRAFPFSTSPQ